MVSVRIEHAAAGAAARAKREGRGQYREGSGRVRTSLREQQRSGRRGQVSKVRLECALIAGVGGSALPSAQEIDKLVMRECGPGTLEMASSHDGTA